MEKTHWKKYINPDYLGAYSLGNSTEMNLTITKVTRAIVKGQNGKEEEKTIAHIKGNKPMILNRTNCKTIQKMYDSPFIEDWAGKQITVYKTKVDAFGERGVETLRIKPLPPKKPTLTPKSKGWLDAIEALKSKSVTMEQIKSKYQLTAANEKALNEGV